MMMTNLSPKLTHVTVQGVRTFKKKIIFNKSQCLLYNDSNYGFINVVSFHQGRPLYKSKKSHYDVLGITPKATKSQIKKSYYKLSMVYHPDQNPNNEESALKFREITEAYEVLGDASKRRLYDRGVHGLRSDYSDETATQFSEVLRRTRTDRKTKAPVSGRTPIYDFDAWSKFHYQENFERKQKAKADYDIFVSQIKKRREDKKSAAILVAAFCMLVSIGVLSTIIVSEDKYKR